MLAKITVKGLVIGDRQAVVAAGMAIIQRNDAHLTSAADGQAGIAHGLAARRIRGSGAGNRGDGTAGDIHRGSAHISLVATQVQIVDLRILADVDIGIAHIKLVAAGLQPHQHLCVTGKVDAGIGLGSIVGIIHRKFCVTAIDRTDGTAHLGVFCANLTVVAAKTHADGIGSRAGQHRTVIRKRNPRAKGQRGACHEIQRLRIGLIDGQIREFRSGKDFHIPGSTAGSSNVDDRVGRIVRILRILAGDLDITALCGEHRLGSFRIRIAAQAQIAAKNDGSVTAVQQCVCLRQGLDGSAGG